MEAWRRVAAVNQNMDGEGQTLESLRLQKDAVKRELKLFDVHFAKFYGRQPSRLDKECLRRLYEFHKQVTTAPSQPSFCWLVRFAVAEEGLAPIGFAGAQPRRRARTRQQLRTRLCVKGGGHLEPHPVLLFVLWELREQLKAYIAAEEVKVERRFAPGMQDSQSSNNRSASACAREKAREQRARRERDGNEMEEGRRK